MLLNTSTLGFDHVLLSFDGELVGAVKEAQVASKEDGGYIVQAVLNENFFTNKLPEDIEWRRREGRVDILGMNGDPREMLMSRIESIRAHMGLPSWASTLKDSTEAQQLSYAAAWMLEGIARKVRRDESVITSISQTKPHENFPLPTPPGWLCVPTGEMTLNLAYKVPALEKEFEAKKAAWAKEHPALVVEYIRSKTEG